jgi:hypothetical protein
MRHPGRREGGKALPVVTVIATVVAAVAAIGGLWAQAVTTYWSQQTAKDHLEQSREEFESLACSWGREISQTMDHRCVRTCRSPASGAGVERVIAG